MTATMPMDKLCSKMRCLVHDCLAKHLYDSAIFYADKLVTMSRSADADVYTLAEAYFMGKQYSRGLALLRNTEIIDSHIKARYLAARCLAELKDWDECMAMLDGVEALEPDPNPWLPSGRGAGAGGEEQEPEMGQAISYTAAVLLLRGQVFQAQENRERAVQAYTAALNVDPFCYEAFQALVEGHMLTSEEEANLRESLNYREEDRWLHLLYRAKCKKYDQQLTMEGTLAALEAPAPTPVPAPPPPTPASSAEAANAAAVTPLQPSASAKLNAHGAARDAPADGGGGVRTRSMAQRRPDPPDTVMQGGGEEEPDEDAENAGVGGCGLGGNLDVAVCRADWLFHLGLYQECYSLTQRLLECDPYALEAMPTHLTAALELRKKNDLFLQAHRLAREYPERAVSWFGIGCYYACIGRHADARRYFGKATGLDPAFPPAWLGFGHAFAAQDESDQAMAAYRTASHMFPGLHAPLLGMGCEYARMNNAPLAEQLLLAAHRICPQDPLPCNELGVLMFRAHSYDAAQQWLQRALERVPGRLSAAWEPTVVNLAHTLRKQRRYDEARVAYERALGLAPGQPGTLAALGYTHHLQGNLQEAIDNYHRALSWRPEDSFTAEMLTIAVKECADQDFVLMG